MGILYLVRHGQASFGQADYDHLSPLGQRQCVKLGDYFRAKGVADFVAGVVAALDHVRTQCNGRVLIVSSGGPISAAVGHVLRMHTRATIDLNLHMRNSAVTEFTFTPKGHALLIFNTLPHLDALNASE